MNVYCSPNIVRMIKSRKLKWTGHVTKIQENRSALKILTDNPIERISFGRPIRR